MSSRPTAPVSRGPSSRPSGDVGDGPKSPGPLLYADEAPAVTVTNPEGRSRLVLVCDHASALVPRRIGDLGLAPEHARSHIAWDPGALEVAQGLSEALDAPLVASGYSRLVVDCNRAPAHPGAMAERSAGIEVPANRGLDEAARRARIETLLEPYHRKIAATLDERRSQVLGLVSVHSFTPHYPGQRRPWEVGISPGAVEDFGLGLHTALAGPGDLCVGLREPYPICADIDFTIPVHGDARGLAAVMIELRQDTLTRHEEIAGWVARLASALVPLGQR